MEKRHSIAPTAIGLWLLVLCILVLACSEDINDSRELTVNGKQPIAFTVDDSQDWMQTSDDIATTRAAEQGLFAPRSTKMVSTSTVMGNVYLNTSVVNGIDAEPIGSEPTRGETYATTPQYIAVSGFSHAANSTPQTPDIFYNIIVHQDGTAWRPVNNDYYWPQNSTSSFFAYAPVATNSNGITLSPATYSGKPTIDFTVQDNVEDQIDLMTASSGPLTWRSGIKARLPFRHALTCVKFVMGSGLPANCRISAIYLKNIAQKGTYTFDEVNPTWVASTTDLTDYAITDINMETSTTENTVIKPQNKNLSYATLLMIPQSFNNANQKIEVFFDDGVNPESSLSATLEGTQWLAGTTVTYKLSSNANQHFVLEVVPALVGHNGGETTFKVTSYKQNGNTKEAMPWRVIGYSTDGITYTTEKPSSQKWVGLMTTEGDGGTEPETGRVLVEAQTATAELLNEADDAAAQKAVMVGNGTRGTQENPWDLSTHNLAGISTPMNTANCYIVNAPGWYKLPLVYGNAITDGVANTDAYTKSPNLDYLDRAITDPYIYNNTDAQSTPYAPKDAIILWQDADSLVTKTHLSADKHFIEFYVDPETIRQGNAVLCVRDATADGEGHAGRIMWSWHIWVTGIDMTPKYLTNANGRHFDLLPVPIGFCSRGGTEATYLGRTIYVKIQQSSGATAVLHIKQTRGVDFTAFTNGNAPYYQWGRAVPWRPATGWVNGTNETDKTWYINSLYSASMTASGISLGTAIKHPLAFYTTTAITPYSSPTNYYRLWDGNAPTNLSTPATTANVQKTIYDPCPSGYHVTGPHTLTGLTVRKANHTMYTNPTNTDWLFVPPLGIRQTSTGAIDKNNYPIGRYVYMYHSNWGKNGNNTAMAMIWYWTSATEFNAGAPSGGASWGRLIYAAIER